MKRFKIWLAENESNLQNSLKKQVNQELYSLVKKASAYQSTKDIVQDVAGVLDGFDVVLVNSDGTEFKGKILDSKGSKEFEIAPRSTINDRSEYTPYGNTKLVVGWSVVDGQVNIKDAYLQ